MNHDKSNKYTSVQTIERAVLSDINPPPPKKKSNLDKQKQFFLQKEFCCFLVFITAKELFVNISTTVAFSVKGLVLEKSFFSSFFKHLVG